MSEPSTCSTAGGQFASLSRLIRSAPTTPKGRTLIVRRLDSMRLSLDRADAERVAEVAGELEAWAERAPGASDAALVLARAGDVLSSHAETRARARSCYERALQHDSEHVHALERLTVCLVEEGEAERVEPLWQQYMQAVCERSHANEADRARSWRRLARMRVNTLGDLDGAIRAYERALEERRDEDVVGELAELHVRRNAPGDREAAAELHFSLAGANDNTLTVSHLERALDLNPSHADALTQLKELRPGRAAARERALKRATGPLPDAPAAASASAPSCDDASPTSEEGERPDQDHAPSTMELTLSNAEVIRVENQAPSTMELTLSSADVISDVKQVAGYRDPLPSSPRHDTHTPRAYRYTPSLVVGLTVAACLGAAYLSFGTDAGLSPLPSAVATSAAPALSEPTAEGPATATPDSPAEEELDSTQPEPKPTARAPVSAAPREPAADAKPERESEPEPEQEQEQRDRPTPQRPHRAKLPDVKVLHKLTLVRGAELPDLGVRRSLRRVERAMQRCYRRALSHRSSPEGRLVVSWIVKPDGSVARVNRPRGSMKHPAAQKCAMETLHAAHFPKPKRGTARIRGGFRFES